MRRLHPCRARTHSPLEVCPRGVGAMRSDNAAGNCATWLCDKARLRQLGMWVKPAMPVDGSELDGRLVAHAGTRLNRHWHS
ncbi:hypothetical protein PXNS11_290322 [Stutzerimonas xanthomarina]|nr:hypothetical protein PXNS11_290322 [Stutzerimonas xanthomarina]